MTARKDADFQEIIVERDNGIDYKFQGELLVDERHEPKLEFEVEYWCGRIQIYHAKYNKCYGYILVTQRHQGVKDDKELFVTEAGLVKDMGMVINLILSKFQDSEVRDTDLGTDERINIFKDGKYVDASGVKQVK